MSIIIKLYVQNRNWKELHSQYFLCVFKVGDDKGHLVYYYASSLSNRLYNDSRPFYVITGKNIIELCMHWANGLYVVL